VRSEPNLKIERYRVTGPPNTNVGAFIIPQARHDPLRVIASDGEGWDHVSVSLPNRCPVWREMCLVQSLWFREDEVVMQLHVAAKDHINVHPFCLHLWKPQGVAIPLPPAWMVGPRDEKARTA
jgi:hypothetical protein